MHELLRLASRHVCALFSTSRIQAQRRAAVRRRFRKLFIEQFEDRRLLAVAVNDDYTLNAGDTLTVTNDGTWANDTYNHGSWIQNDFVCSDYHDEPWSENRVYLYSDWDYSDPDNPVWTDYFDDSNATFHDAGCA